MKIKPGQEKRPKSEERRRRIDQIFYLVKVYIETIINAGARWNWQTAIEAIVRQRVVTAPSPVQSHNSYSTRKDNLFVRHLPTT